MTVKSFCLSARSWGGHHAKRDGRRWIWIACGPSHRAHICMIRTDRTDGPPIGRAPISRVSDRGPPFFSPFYGAAPRARAAPSAGASARSCPIRLLTSVTVTPRVSHVIVSRIRDVSAPPLNFDHAICCLVVPLCLSPAARRRRRANFRDNPPGSQKVTYRRIQSAIFGLWIFVTILTCLPFFGFGLYYDMSLSGWKRCSRYDRAHVFPISSQGPHF